MSNGRERSPPVWTLEGRLVTGCLCELEVGVTWRVRGFTPDSSHLQCREGKCEVSAFSLRAQQESWVEQQMRGWTSQQLGRVSVLSTSMENPNAALSSLLTGTEHFAADKGSVCAQHI